MKNIGIIIPSLTKGGAERAAGLLSKVLCEQYNVYLFITGDRPITYQHGGTIINIHLNEEYDKLKRKYGMFGSFVCKLAYLRAIKRIKRFKQEYNIDCSISFLETCNLFNLFSSNGERIILSVRSTRSLQNDTTIAKIENLGIELFYNRADYIVPLSYGVGDDLARNFGVKRNKIRTIYNFFDFEDIIKKSNTPISQELQKTIRGKKIICTMGRMIPSKNQLWLIDVCHSVFKKMPDSVLIIMGDGELKNQIKEKIEQLNEANRIIVLDYQSNPFPIIRAADIFAMATEREGFCNSIVEAMACGTAVVSTDCLCGPREIIGDIKEYQTKINDVMYCTRGVLVPERDKEKMIKAICYLFENDDYRRNVEEEGIKYVATLSNKDIKNQWIGLIEGK